MKTVILSSNVSKKLVDRGDILLYPGVEYNDGHVMYMTRLGIYKLKVSKYDLTECSFDKSSYEIYKSELLKRYNLYVNFQCTLSWIINPLLSLAILNYVPYNEYTSYILDRTEMPSDAALHFLSGISESFSIYTSLVKIVKDENHIMHKPIFNYKNWKDGSIDLPITYGIATHLSDIPFVDGVNTLHRVLTTARHNEKLEIYKRHRPIEQYLKDAFKRFISDAISLSYKFLEFLVHYPEYVLDLVSMISKVVSRDIPVVIESSPREEYMHYSLSDKIRYINASENIEDIKTITFDRLRILDFGISEMENIKANSEKPLTSKEIDVMFNNMMMEEKDKYDEMRKRLYKISNLHNTVAKHDIESYIKLNKIELSDKKDVKSAQLQDVEDKILESIKEKKARIDKQIENDAREYFLQSLGNNRLDESLNEAKAMRKHYLEALESFDKSTGIEDNIKIIKKLEENGDLGNIGMAKFSESSLAHDIIKENVENYNYEQNKKSIEKLEYYPDGYDKFDLEIIKTFNEDIIKIDEDIKKLDIEKSILNNLKNSRDILNEENFNKLSEAFDKHSSSMSPDIKDKYAELVKIYNSVKVMTNEELNIKINENKQQLRDAKEELGDKLGEEKDLFEKLGFFKNEFDVAPTTIIKDIRKDDRKFTEDIPNETLALTKVEKLYENFISRQTKHKELTKLELGINIDKNKLLDLTNKNYYTTEPKTIDPNDNLYNIYWFESLREKFKTENVDVSIFDIKSDNYKGTQLTTPEIFNSFIKKSGLPINKKDYANSLSDNVCFEVYNKMNEVQKVASTYLNAIHYIEPSKITKINKNKTDKKFNENVESAVLERLRAINQAKTNIETIKASNGYKENNKVAVEDLKKENKKLKDFTEKPPVIGDTEIEKDVFKHTLQYMEDKEKIKSYKIPEAPVSKNSETLFSLRTVLGDVKNKIKNVKTGDIVKSCNIALDVCKDKNYKWEKPQYEPSNSYLFSADAIYKSHNSLDSCKKFVSDMINTWKEDEDFVEDYLEFPDPVDKELLDKHTNEYNIRKDLVEKIKNLKGASHNINFKDLIDKAKTGEEGNVNFPANKKLDKLLDNNNDVKSIKEGIELYEKISYALMKAGNDPNISISQQDLYKILSIDETIKDVDKEINDKLMEKQYNKNIVQDSQESLNKFQRLNASINIINDLWQLNNIVFNDTFSNIPYLNTFSYTGMKTVNIIKKNIKSPYGNDKWMNNLYKQVKNSLPYKEIIRGIYDTSYELLTYVPTSTIWISDKTSINEKLNELERVRNIVINPKPFVKNPLEGWVKDSTISPHEEVKIYFGEIDKLSMNRKELISIISTTSMMVESLYFKDNKVLYRIPYITPLPIVVDEKSRLVLENLMQGMDIVVYLGNIIEVEQYTNEEWIKVKVRESKINIGYNYLEI